MLLCVVTVIDLSEDQEPTSSGTYVISPYPPDILSIAVITINKIKLEDGDFKILRQPDGWLNCKV